MNDAPEEQQPADPIDTSDDLLWDDEWRDKGGYANVVKPNALTSK